MKAFLIIILIPIIACSTNEQTNPDNQDFHIHADFKVYLNGIPYNFSKEKYMSEEDESIHLHDMDGDIIHMHKEGTTLEEFFSSLGMQFTKDCFVLDNKTKYCNSKKNTLKMYVNGKKNTQFQNYVFNDLDRILISYGNETNLTNQMDSVTDKACIQSGSCPERGTASEESCASGTDVCAI